MVLFCHRDPRMSSHIEGEIFLDACLLPYLPEVIRDACFGIMVELLMGFLSFAFVLKYGKEIRSVVAEMPVFVYQLLHLGLPPDYQRLACLATHIAQEPITYV